MVKLRKFAVYLLAATALLLLLFPRAASAHTRVMVGDYAIVVGWVQEPPIVGERNALFIEITSDEIPVTGAEATLSAEILYGGRTFLTNLNPHADNPGQYTAEILPTVRGQYTVRLVGSINDQPVDESIEPEEVFAATRLQFPESQPNARELQQEMERNMQALESQLRTARLLALAGVVMGGAGIGLAFFSLRARRDTG